MENYKNKIENLYNKVKYSASVEDSVVAKKLEEAFPELKPSKDESIRKAIIDFIKVSKPEWENCRDYASWVNWLERQGKPTTIDIDKMVNEYANNNECGNEGFGKPVNCMIRAYRQGINDALNLSSGIEKQGESKPADKVEHKDYNSIDPHFGKPIDKVEPKFKVGDWVVTSYGKVNQVITVDEDGDGFTLDDDTYFSGSWKDTYHLWTIQDAKDGDVLISQSGNPLIYNGNYNSLNIGAKDSELQEETYFIPDGFHAEIDDDKVVIKKGEKSAAWNVEDSSKVQRICKYLDEAKKYYADITEVRECMDWLKSLKQRIGG